MKEKYAEENRSNLEDDTEEKWLVFRLLKRSSSTRTKYFCSHAEELHLRLKVSKSSQDAGVYTRIYSFRQLSITNFFFFFEGT